MAHLAFVGLGNMGTGMALRLIGAGHEVTVWNRTVDAADSLVAAGATRAANPEDAFSAEVVFSMLAHDRAAEAVFTAEVLAPTGSQPFMRRPESVTSPPLFSACPRSLLRDS
jgi:3-hydroxyisobutyrate dehydrogenase-like beta-hydroxyacid dehydrogenase